MAAAGQAFGLARAAPGITPIFRAQTTKYSRLHVRLRAYMVRSSHLACLPVLIIVTLSIAEKAVQVTLSSAVNVAIVWTAAGRQLETEQWK